MIIRLIDPPGFSRGISTGLAYLGACAKQAGYSNIRVIDIQNNRRQVEERLNKIIQEKPDILGITLNSFTILNGLKIIKKIKTALPHTKFIAGGPGVTSDPQIFLQRTNKLFDIAVYKEGELTFIELLNSFKNQNPALENIRGISYYNPAGEIITNPAQALIGKLDSLPIPNYEIFDSFDKNFGSRPYQILTSRGCPGRCVFCMNPLLNDGCWRGRSVDNVINELISAKQRYNIKSFVVRDDNFTQDMDRAEKICDRLIELNFNISWKCKAAVRADRVRPSLLQKMKLSGCDSLTLGIETGNPEIFPLVRKGESLETIQKGIEMIKAAHIDVAATMVIGLINDTYSSVLKSINFLKKIKINAHWYLALPFRGTELFDWVEKNGKFLIDCDFIDVFSHSAQEIVVPFETSDFTATERRRAYYKANITSSNFYFIWTDGFVGRDRYKHLSRLGRAKIILKTTLKYQPTYIFKALKYLIKTALSVIKENKIKSHKKTMSNPQNEEKKVKVDVGCGKLKLDGFIGIDIDPRCDADIVASATELPFEDNSVDEIYSSHLGEHLTKNQLKQFLDEVYRVLKPGATAFIKMDHDWSKKRLFRKDKTHVCRHSVSYIQEFVKKFKEAKVKNAIYPTTVSGTLLGFGLFNKIILHLKK